MARPSWANSLGCRDFELNLSQYAPSLERVKKKILRLATWGRRCARLSGSTLAAGSHARSEAGEATRSTGEDEAGAWPEHRAHRPAVLVHLPAAAMVFA